MSTHGPAVTTPTADEIEARSEPRVGGYAVSTEDFHLLLGGYSLGVDAAEVITQQQEQTTRMALALARLGEAHDLALRLYQRATPPAKDDAMKLERLLMQISRWRVATREEMAAGLDASRQGEDSAGSAEHEGQAELDTGATVESEPESSSDPFKGAARITGLQPATGDQEVPLDHALSRYGVPTRPGDVRSERLARSQRQVMKRMGITGPPPQGGV